MVRRFALPPRAVRSASSGAGRIAVPGIAADPRARILGVQRSGSRLAPRCPSLHSGTGSTGHAGPAPWLGRPSARRAGGRGARKLVHSGAVGRPGTGLSPPGAAGSGRRPRPRIGRWPGLRSGCRASTGAGNPASQPRVPSARSWVIWRRWPPGAVGDGVQPVARHRQHPRRPAGPGRPGTRRRQREPRLISARRFAGSWPWPGSPGRPPLPAHGRLPQAGRCSKSAKRAQSPLTVRAWSKAILDRHQRQMLAVSAVGGDRPLPRSRRCMQATTWPT